MPTLEFWKVMVAVLAAAVLSGFGSTYVVSSGKADKADVQHQQDGLHGDLAVVTSRQIAVLQRLARIETLVSALYSELRRHEAGQVGVQPRV